MDQLLHYNCVDSYCFPHPRLVYLCKSQMREYGELGERCKQDRRSSFEVFCLGLQLQRVPKTIGGFKARGGLGFSLIPSPPLLLNGEFEGPRKVCGSVFIFTFSREARDFGDQRRGSGDFEGQH